MMVEKYVIQMLHHRALGDDFAYYYKGQNHTGANCFDFRKNLAKRYTRKEEAIRDMCILKAVHEDKHSDDFSVIAIRCKI